MKYLTTQIKHKKGDQGKIKGETKTRTLGVL